MNKSEVITGNCLAALQNIADNSIDAIVTDPPYCQGTTNDVTKSTRKKYEQTGKVSKAPIFFGDDRTQRGLQLFLNAVFLECYRVAKSGGLFLCFFDFKNLSLATDAAQLAGFRYLGIVPWDKTTASRPMRPFRRQCEFIGVFSKRRMIDAPCSPGLVTARSKHEFHMTQKPDVVMDHCLAAVKPGGVVLDPFCGSGSTGIAALKRGCDFIGIELVPEIADVAKNRIAQWLA